MGKKDKKKGKGAEKTAAKTEKKESTKLKKKLAAIGEDDVEAIIAQIEREENKRQQVKEVKVDPPSRRINFSFIPHPDKDELILFGGEYFNGQRTLMYNDLYTYSISNNSWTQVKAPSGPAPRCGHQLVTSSANKGQLWLFGGEFASPTQSQFYHYKDLWLYHLAEKRWEKITAPNGPSARSGHRMVYVKKQLIVFGGFHDNLRDYKYFNDVYCFNTENYTWVKLEPSGNGPAPRSSCVMVGLNDGRILIYGGYSKEKIKKDVDKGHVFNDAFVLTPDKNDISGLKWKWVQTKLSGIHFSQRSGLSIAPSPNNTAYVFGGVFDVEDDEEISGTFYNDCFMLDLSQLSWRQVVPSGKKDTKSKQVEEMEVDENSQPPPAEPTVIADDGIFTVTIGGASATAAKTSVSPPEKVAVFKPSPRMNCGLAIKHGVLYLYGGMFEDGDKELTFSDFYCLDIRKVDEWKTLIKDDQVQEWLESESESDKDESSESEGGDEDENDSGTESKMQTDQ